MNMGICYFGNFNPEYARNRVIIKGLRENGVEVLVCHTNFKGLKGLIDLFKKHHDLKNKYDILIIGYSDSRSMVPLVRFLSSKPVVWDAFYSLYDSWVFDRKLVGPKSLKAKYYWFLDWLNCKLSNIILLDTNEHIKYFSKTFYISSPKFLKVLVGTDDKIFYPREKDGNNQNLTVHFHGKFIPLQGTEYIIRAAHILKNERITFRIIGTGQEYNRIKNLAEKLELTNIVWIDRVSYNELAEYIKNADICLGVFGNTEKAQRVIPNKIYEAIAIAKPVITADTPAIRELFTDRENILLSKVANSDDLAQKILELKNNPDLRHKISNNGYEIFKNRGTPKMIGEKLFQDLKILL